MKALRILTIIILVASTALISQEMAQTDAQADQTEKQEIAWKHSIGSTLFLLGNFAPGDPPYFFQLNYGYQLSKKEVVMVEAITWTYYEPLATYGDSDQLYPGKVRAMGVGLGYQRFLWKNLYSTLQATPFLQQFFDEDDQKIQNGFQLYLQIRVGYRFEFFAERWFIEPSVAFNYWPVNNNFPKTFKDVESGKDNYFLFEPGLHFGFKF